MITRVKRPVQYPNLGEASSAGLTPGDLIKAPSGRFVCIRKKPAGLPASDGYILSIKKSTYEAALKRQHLEDMIRFYKPNFRRKSIINIVKQSLISFWNS